MPPHVFLYGVPGQFPNYERALIHAGAVVRFGDFTDCDGLLLPGGGDIHPSTYGAEVLDCRDIDQNRDREELELCERFISEGKPVLGICRGLQVLNVVLGGTLCQHIEGHSSIDGRDRIHHTTASPRGFVGQLYGQSLAVNSAHHQMLDRLGHGLEAVQWTGDGVVEAATHRILPIWGVQWHPERLEQRHIKSGIVSGQRLIDSFVDRLPY